MKVKKIISSVLLAFTLVVGGLSQAKPANADTLSKDQVVSIIKDNKANSVKLDGTISVKPVKSKKSATLVSLSGEVNNEVVHITAKALVSDNEKEQNVVEMWASTKEQRTYVYSDGKWEYAPISDATKDAPYEKLAKLLSQEDLFGKALKNSKLTHNQDGSDTLKTAVNVNKYYPTYLKMISKEAKLTKKDLKYLKKNIKISKVHVTYTVKDNKLIGVESRLNYTLAKSISCEAVFSISNVDEYPNLAVPDSVKNSATPVKAEK